MRKDVGACKNGNCIAYKDNECLRAIIHKEAIIAREPMVAYIPNRNNTKICELYIKEIK